MEAFGLQMIDVRIPCDSILEDRGRVLDFLQVFIVNTTRIVWLNWLEVFVFLQRR